MGSRRGFTLVELLVVIAIIAVLAAILFPVFSSAKEAGRRASCQSNLVNISRAMLAYKDDNNGKYCGIWQGARTGNTTYDHHSFFFVITTYIGQKLEREGDGTGKGNDRTTVYRCPSAPWLKQQFTSGVTTSLTNTGFAYTMNETGWSEDVRTPSRPALYRGVREADIRSTSRLIMVGEGMGWVGYGMGYGQGELVNNANPSSNVGRSNNPTHDEEIPLSRPGKFGRNHGSTSKAYNVRVSHNMGAMLLFYDGHTELRQTTKGYNWRL